MRALKQLGGGVLIALISLVLVVGGISLALNESLPAQATPTPIPPTISLDFPTATFTVSAVFSDTQTATATAELTNTPSFVATNTIFATNTLFVQASCVPPTGWIPITTLSGDTIYTLAQRYKTTPENLANGNCFSSFDVPPGYVMYVPLVPTITVIPCGPPPGYVKRYVVQRGDTLYSVATLYRITYPTLQRANCMGSSTTIYAGQLLWVPNIIIPTRYVPTPTTIIITFPTATPAVTLEPTATSVPPATNTTVPPTVVPPTTALPNTPVVNPTDTTPPQ